MLGEPPPGGGNLVLDLNDAEASVPDNQRQNDCRFELTLAALPLLLVFFAFPDLPAVLRQRLQLRARTEGVALHGLRHVASKAFAQGVSGFVHDSLREPGASAHDNDVTISLSFNQKNRTHFSSQRGHRRHDHLVEEPRHIGVPGEVARDARENLVGFRTRCGVRLHVIASQGRWRTDRSPGDA